MVWPHGRHTPPGALQDHPVTGHTFPAVPHQALLLSSHHHILSSQTLCGGPKALADALLLCFLA
ncbi:hypothetical protein E2C01_018408 [Portunus trituberculatus]|uniref:Uncharacterized protein n=1 Tax=Portunus trituberculatus TaxID=210409 RepID=A0A5B7DUE6_PORTR|nr:hypothetical protein [Portunus trituberculatus]